MKSKIASAEQLNPNDVPFGIENAVLAFALDLAGVPGAEPSAVNSYTRDMLFEIGDGVKDESGEVTRPSRFAGLSFEDAARAAVKEGKKGSVKYRFKREPGLSALCKAYTDQEKKLKDGETVNTTEAATEIARQMVVGEIEKSEGILRLTCLILKCYITFKQQWRAFPPIILADNPGKTRRFDTTIAVSDGKGGTKVVPAKGVSSPGYRGRSVNASQAVKDRVKL